MSISLHIALAAETHLTEGLTLKLWLTTKIEKSLILLEGIRKLTVIKYGRTTEFIFKYINKKNIKMFPSGMKRRNIKSR
jgi:hypothetical protein